MNGVGGPSPSEVGLCGGKEVVAAVSGAGICGDLQCDRMSGRRLWMQSLTDYRVVSRTRAGGNSRQRRAAGRRNNRAGQDRDTARMGV